MSTIEIYVRLAILLVLIILSSIFSATETAITGVTASQITKLKENDEKSANLLKKMKLRINEVLSTILIGNNLVNIAATTIITEMGIQLLKGQSTVITTAITTVIIIIFGEITPKTYASQNSIKIIKSTIKPLQFLTFIMKPLLFILDKVTWVIFKIIGGDPNSRGDFVTEEDIRSLVDAGEEEGVLMYQEKEMIQNIFEIDDLEVGEIMVPRVDIIAVSNDSSLEEILNVAIKYGLSRVPVYEDSVDNIVGIIYAKDLLPLVFSKEKKIDLNKMIRSAYYVPETKKINELLKELRNTQIHMAIILDEYGATEGLITIEDILEEIVGEIFDEFDNEEDDVIEVNKDIYKIKGDSSLEDMEKIFDVDLPKEEFDSIGGYIFNTLGKLPIPGDIVEFGNLEMKVLGMKKRRVTVVEVRKIEKEEDYSNGE